MSIKPRFFLVFVDRSVSLGNHLISFAVILQHAIMAYHVQRVYIVKKHELENRATLVSCACDTNSLVVHSRYKLGHLYLIIIIIIIIIIIFNTYFALFL